MTERNDIPEAVFTPKILLQIAHTFDQLGISQLMKTEGVTEIAINEEGIIFYEKYSQWKQIEQPGNKSNDLINGLGILLVNKQGQQQSFDHKNPMLSLTMPGGERAQLVRKPAAEECSLTVRIPSNAKFSMDEYESSGLFREIVPMTDEITPQDQELKTLLANKKYREFLELAVKYRKNIVVSGATGSGKTTFMKTLIDLISHDERIITIEDARELFIDHPNKVHLMYPKSMSESAVTAKSCLEATLRMKPDRIILAEVRGDEAFYFIRACGNGHSGSITSCHADSALMAYEQLALMINASPEGSSLSYDVIRRLIMMTIDISIHFANHNGKRYITAIDFNPERKLQMLTH
ncbi:P-type DNA transfer ATPase VirB11 [Suttonella ornithocola]